MPADGGPVHKRSARNSNSCRRYRRLREVSLRSTRRVTRPKLIPTLAVSLGLTLVGCSTSGTVADGGSGGETGSGGIVGAGGGTGGVKGSGGATGGSGSGGQVGSGGTSGTGGAVSTGTGGGRRCRRIRWSLGNGRRGRPRRGGKRGHGRRQRNRRLTYRRCRGQWRRRRQRRGRRRWRCGRHAGDRRRGRHDRGRHGPCDLYAAGNTPCVAAHSTVRALYGAYGGALYQVRRASDKSTKDIPVLGSGGYAELVRAGYLLRGHHLHDLRHL